MKTQTKEMYRCDYCDKWYHRKHAAIAHEKSCSKNPDNKRVCIGCKYLDKKNVDIYHDTFDGGEHRQAVSLLHCDKLSKFVYPPKVEHKNNAYDLGYESNDPMPRDCIHVEYDVMSDFI